MLAQTHTDEKKKKKAFWSCFLMRAVVSGFNVLYSKSCFKSWIENLSESILTAMLLTLKTDILLLPEETRWMVASTIYVSGINEEILP
jgi:hypothetical protein